ncbi:MAG TPA: SDR family oxidoreductase [Dehalococcoidia bacterium]|nr:SDR family oxidoreductase [Dehalococcoidia bacterium]
MKLRGKVAIITGASRGIGRFMAIELAKEGCDIVVAARTEEVTDPKLPGTIYSTAEELRALGVRALPVRTDVTDETSVDAMVRETLREFGRIDVLINNAGIMTPGRLIDLPLKRWDLIWRVNVRGAVACCKAVLPTMIEQRDGVIINISSIAVDRPGASNIPYRITKRALRDLAEGLAEEVKEHNIRVFALSPEGLVLTPGTLYHRLDEQAPAGPFVEPPEAMGRAAVYLCSPEAAPRSGQHFYSRQLLREIGAPV